MFLILGLGMLAFFLLAAIVFVARSGSGSSQQVAQSFVQPVFAQPVYRTAREQDKEVKANLAAKWYAEALDEKFKQETLEEIQAFLSTRK